MISVCFKNTLYFAERGLDMLEEVIQFIDFLNICIDGYHIKVTYYFLMKNNFHNNKLFLFLNTCTDFVLVILFKLNFFKVIKLNNKKIK